MTTSGMGLYANFRLMQRRGPVHSNDGLRLQKNLPLMPAISAAIASIPDHRAGGDASTSGASGQAVGRIGDRFSVRRLRPSAHFQKTIRGLSAFTAASWGAALVQLEISLVL